jgi:hypothetical protein
MNLGAEHTMPPTMQIWSRACSVCCKNTSDIAKMTEQIPQPEEPQILQPEDAKEILRAAITEKLGAGWDDADSKWEIVTSTAYMARLNKGRVNVDFYVNYFDGEITIETGEIDHGQDTGRIFAWMMFGLFVVIVVMLAQTFGVI